MPGLTLFTSNRLEILIRELALLLQTPLEHPLEKEIIVVQSKGMERWISLELARHNGICANVRFPFPSHIIADVFREVLPETMPDPDPFAPSVMTWDIIRLLPPLLPTEGFELLERYLAEQGKDIRLFQLARRIAETFDHYLLFRPDMILAWEDGSERHWQARLWQALAGEKDRRHQAALQKELLEAILTSRTPLRSLPGRISVFGISALPPFHIKILTALSRLQDIHLFLMNPCAEYWGDIVSDRDINRLTARLPGNATTSEDLYLEKGNSLLASLGAQGRDFFELLNGCGDIQDIPLFADPGGETALSAIQSDIMNLREPDSQAKRPLSPADDSIRIHACHSPMREIEVLQDQLLGLFESHPDLKPADILVMAPDISLYSPFIQAVFSLPKEDPRWMPFSIADRGFRQESPLTDHFLKFLDLPESRFSAMQVYEILESPAVRDHFSLSESDLDLIHRWISATGIRWGIDADTKKSFDLPAGQGNTWRQGLDRMLLGYALSSQEEERLFAGILPYSDMEGSDTAIFEQFLTFMEHLFPAVDLLNKSRPLGEWAEVLSSILTTFFAADQEPYARDVQLIRKVFSDLASLEQTASFSGAVSLEVIKAWLKDHFENSRSGHGFLTGGVTFCAMLPMRSLPFKAVCLVGMSDGAYPREAPTLGFDLMASLPRKGDRSRRQDDRYLFLEALLSARRHFYISYMGQSIEDNSQRPPSVLVSELLDYMEEGFSGQAGVAVRDILTTRHPLQAFNASYFSAGTNLFSYSNENCAAALQACRDRQVPTGFLTAPLPEPGEEWRHVDLGDLCRFFNNPAAYLLGRRLGIRLEKDALTLDENEPFTLENLEKYQVRQDLTAKALAERDLRDLYPVLAASGQLPHGTPGQYAYGKLCRSVMDLADHIRPFTAGAPSELLDMELTVGPFFLTGRMDSIYGGQAVFFRPADIKAKDYLRAWICHLALNLSRPLQEGSHTLLIFDNRQCRLRPPGDVEKVLQSLLNLYFEGLTKPLKFFPESSWAYARQYREGKDRGKALKAAHGKWDGFRFPEKDDPFLELCFGHDDPLDGMFINLALTVMDPLLDHLESLP